MSANDATHARAVGRPHIFRRTARAEQRRLEGLQLEVDETNGRGAYARQRLADAGCPLSAELTTRRTVRGPGRWRVYVA